jgi:CheY-like chemotaxis protein
MKASPKILIVDDDPDFIEIGRLSWKERVSDFSASTGREGWEMVQKKNRTW